MLKKILNIVQIPIKIILVCVMAYGIYSYFNQVFVNEDVDYGASFHSLPENSMDVIVLGSSHAQYSFVPSFFYEDTGLYSYVMGSACQPLEVSYEMLKEALKTQSPKIVILETYTAMPLRSICEADVCYVKGQYLMTGEEKYNTINYLEEDKAKTYYNDFINLHNNWKNIESIDDLKPSKKLQKLDSNIVDNFGHVYLEPAPLDNYWRAATFKSKEEVELDELDLISLNNIYSLCKENNIELILYKTPIDSMDITNQSYLHKVWEWADANEVPYLDFFALQEKLDFNMWIYSDSYHCFINGAGVVTGEIADFIKQNYDIDHQENEMLTSKYLDNALKNDLNYLKYESNIYKCLRRMKHQEATLLIKYNANGNMEDRLYQNIVDLGFTEGFDLNQDYYAVVKNGELIDYAHNELELELNNKTILINEKTLEIDGEEISTKGNLSIVMFDKELNKHTTKNIDYSAYPWEYGYDYYYKK